MNFAKLHALYRKYEGRISSAALVGGFIFDSFTIQRIDRLFESLSIFSYLVLSGVSIAISNYFYEHPPRSKFFAQLNDFLPILIQFAFGGLFSAFFIFYYRGGTFSASWPFMLILLFLLVGNEFFKARYRRLTFQISIYFLAVFSFLIFFVPVVLKSMGVWVFLLSGVLSLVVIFTFSFSLIKVVPKRYKEHKRNVRNSIITIFLVINILYFLNLIPPIPLSLKNAGIFYSIERVDGGYRAIGEKKSWYQLIPFLTYQTISLREGEPLYFFSSVFAPTDLNTKIIHDWQYYDEKNKKWVSANKVGFPITGGRSEGYRGFSKKDNLFSGKWRVDIKTERGQIVGRVRLNIRTGTPLEFQEKIF